MAMLNNQMVIVILDWQTFLDLSSYANLISGSQPKLLTPTNLDPRSASATG